MRNKPFAFVLSAALASAGFAVADTASTTPPPPKVEVFSFTPVGDVAGSEWVGKGIQSSLQGDVASSGAQLVINTTALETSDPVAAAKSTGATTALVGTFQIVNGEIRANAHLIDVNSGTTLGSFSATEKREQLFKLEDELGTGLTRLLPAKAVDTAQATQPAPTQVPAATAQPASPPSTNVTNISVQPAQAQQPVVTYLPSQATEPAGNYISSDYYYPQTVYTPDYSYGYSTPFYGSVYIGGYYGYPYSRGYYGGGYGGYHGGYSGYHGGYIGGYRGGVTSHFSIGGGHISVGGHFGGRR